MRIARLPSGTVEVVHLYCTVREKAHQKHYCCRRNLRGVKAETHADSADDQIPKPGV